MVSSDGQGKSPSLVVMFFACIVVALICRGFEFIFHWLTRVSSFHVAVLPLIMPFLRTLLIAFNEHRKLAKEKLVLLLVSLVAGIVGAMIGMVGAILRDWQVGVVVTGVGLAIAVTPYLRLEAAIQDSPMESGD